MPLIDKLTGLFSSGASKLVDSVGGVLDNLITNKEELAVAKLELQKEVNRNLEALQSDATKQLELELKDVADARSSNVQLQTSEKVPLFNKLVPYAIACFTGLIWGGMTVYVIATMLNIIKRDPSVNFEGVLGIYAGLTGTFGIILNFFFGSSKSSEDKQKWMQKMMDK